ncbi:heptaprenylglyceryl phosphate synthase [Phocicoccus pinnipedialis]|uniref:Heptaprenylglyceryl phosphate synthase n=1 Tax=Phocicoccus pinnipedialis TaxID=110845 RepID=A0A6V7RAN3_9BACL|nr:heptaprenylglyceryl phosphate synthase [Jeotgalicoccus pinnipedialis]MBP1940208.1 putative glycerol-1-phosphate prenyltransferase [Jeotgalicoccus pinnipedialis]CAD2074024.1 Heptaprenylglyceryl phosphate synthase [Jeotgalicoccus pinnipedialis]
MLSNVKHIFKLDPNKEISDENLQRVCESGTDLILVGGTDGVTEDNVLDLLARVRRYSVPLALEVTNVDSVTAGFDHYFVPSVFNTDDINYRDGILAQALESHFPVIDFEEISLFPYIILNEDSKAFKKSNAYLPDEKRLTSILHMMDKLYKFPYIYIEYSGKLGSIDKVKEISNTLENSKMIYGGGIRNAEEAGEYSEVADIVVVGNAIYDDLKQALKTVARSK